MFLILFASILVNLQCILVLNVTFSAITVDSSKGITCSDLVNIIEFSKTCVLKFKTPLFRDRIGPCLQASFYLNQRSTTECTV